MAWKKLDSEKLVDSRWVKVSKEKVELPNGEMINDFYVVTIPNAAGIVALTPENEVILKKEFRYTCNEDLIEIPAGTFEPEEQDPLVVAQRELREETGYVSRKWTYLGKTVESSSKLTNRMHLFLAEECEYEGEPMLDSTEVLDVFLVDLKKAVDMVMSNEICCNSTAHGILKTWIMRGCK